MTKPLTGGIASEYKQAIERVRELHYRYNAGTACDCCESEPDECVICGDYYPCPTIKALDGKS
jgi:hypothetical protein